MSSAPKYSIGLEELQSREHRLWRSIVGEFLGNFILNFFASGACTQPEDGTFKEKKNISEIQGLGIEFFLGLLLVLTVFGACDPNKPDSRFTAPFAIGMAVTLGHLGTIRFTSTGMNPARSFGTAYATNNWESHWVYWAGPILGGIVACLVYLQILEKPADPPKPIEASDKYRIHAYEREMKKLETTRDFA